MGNIKTLKHIRPGQVLNPAGRPKGAKGRKTMLKWMMSLFPKEVLPLQTYVKLKEQFPFIDEYNMEQFLHMTQMERAALKRDTYAYNSLMNGLYGMPRQETEVITPDGGPAVVFILPPKDQ